MLLLTILASFGMFTVLLLIGIAIGYAIGNKNDRTLRQQVKRWKTVSKKHNKSGPLPELTPREVEDRANFDLRTRLAELTGNPLTSSYDTPRNEDPNSMENTF